MKSKRQITPEERKKILLKQASVKVACAQEDSLEDYRIATLQKVLDKFLAKEKPTP